MGIAGMDSQEWSAHLYRLERSVKRNNAKRIAEYEIIDHGEDHPQYFQGCGVSFTRFDACYTGVGENAKEAYEDAADQVASSGEWNADTLPTRPRGIRKDACVNHKSHESGRDDNNEAPYGQDQECDGSCEMYWYVSIRVRGPLPRKAARKYTRDDVETHRVGYGGRSVPAINVKSYSFPRASQVQEEFKCSEEVAERALEFAFQSAQEQFWQDIQDTVRYVLGEETVRVFSEGRSGGWLVVEGLPDVSEWNAIRLEKWRKLEKIIKAEIQYLESWEQVRDAIESNQWAEDGAEEYNFVDTPSGPKCVAELNREIAAATKEVREKFLSGPQ